MTRRPLPSPKPAHRLRRCDKAHQKPHTHRNQYPAAEVHPLDHEEFRTLLGLTVRQFALMSNPKWLGWSLKTITKRV